MEARTVYCPKCDHDVSVTVSPAPLHGGHASIPEGGELVCLDFGPKCEGRLCAITALPRAVMGIRLAQSGLRPEQLEHVRALCQGCERVVELEVVDPTHALCPSCHTVNIWAMVRLDGEEWVAVTGARAESELS
jgi:hypothetical protein